MGTKKKSKSLVKVVFPDGSWFIGYRGPWEWWAEPFGYRNYTIVAGNDGLYGSMEFIGMKGRKISVNNAQIKHKVFNWDK